MEINTIIVMVGNVACKSFLMVKWSDSLIFIASFYNEGSITRNGQVVKRFEPCIKIKTHLLLQVGDIGAN
jgi:hypothetical protein